MGLQSTVQFLIITACLISGVTAAGAVADPDERMGCNLEQKGLHMKLHCTLTPNVRGAWDECTINIDLARGNLLLYCVY